MNIAQDTKEKVKNTEQTPIVAITHGDINGIGYEVIMKALSDQRIFDFMKAVIYGISKIGSYHRNALNLKNFNFNLVRDINAANPKRANIINITNSEVKVELGKETPIAGEIALLSLQKAVEDLKRKNAEILVTAPVSKKNIQIIHPDFTGHTEYLAKSFNIKDYLMIMCSPAMKIGLATTHVPLSKVSELINQEMLTKKIYLFYQTLIQDFSISKPKLAVLALNPHAGENGLFGNEEKDIIYPVINKMQNEGLSVFGPFSADGFFGALKYKEFDGIMAMYHDQGLIPFKTVSFDEGVNFTAGLPIVRTSPAHGTAFEIAGQNIASEKSFLNAIFLALEIYKNRKKYQDNYATPLKLTVEDLQQKEGAGRDER